jgi:hypothetical protein
MIGMRMLMTMLVIMIVGQMDIEFHTGDSGFLLARNMEVITIEPQFLQLMLEQMRIHAEVQQSRQKHIAADTAENVQVESFHIIM